MKRPRARQDESLFSFSTILKLVGVTGILFMAVNLRMILLLEENILREVQHANDGAQTSLEAFNRTSRGVTVLYGAQPTCPNLTTASQDMSGVTSQYGVGPHFLFDDTCATFREQVPAVRRMLGAAGMFSTGTNLVTQLLKRNCYIPERLEKYGGKATKEQLGMRWQVPWGKHTPASFRDHHATKQAAAISKDDILPIVTIRHPYRWMQSMCKNPYAARWKHAHVCPHLHIDGEWNPVSVKYGAGVVNYTSLVHLWTDWYQEYLQASYPRIFVRMEDLIYFREATVQHICECAGGKMTEIFFNVEDSAKADSPGHDVSMGWKAAWTKYAKPLPNYAGFVPEDGTAAMEVLQGMPLLEMFGYQMPPSDEVVGS